MPVRQNDFFYPIALKHLSGSERTKAHECFQKALSVELTPHQINRFANTTAAWEMKQAPDKRADLLDAVLAELNPDYPSHAALARRILNQVHHAWAFDAYFNGDWPEVGHHVVETLLTKPSLIRNRGLLSIWVRSTLAQHGLAHRWLPARTPAAPEGEDISAIDRARVEALVGHPVQKWQKIHQTSPYTPRFRVYSYQDGRHQHVARVATSGSIMPVKAVMDEVAKAGVSLPEIKIDLEGTQTSSGIRVETFISGEYLNLSACTDGLACRIIDQLGETFQRLHDIEVAGFGPLNNQLAAAASTFQTMRDDLEQKVFEAFLDDALPEPAAKLAAQLFNDLEENPYDGLPRLCHCDLHPENILVQNGKLSGLIDWEFAQGHDPAYDVAQFLAFGIEFWDLHASEAFFSRITAASTATDHQDYLRRVKTYLPLCVMDLLPSISKFSLPHPWRNAGKMQRFLLKSLKTPARYYTFAA